MADGTGSLVEGLGAELLNNTGIHPISPWDIHGEIYGMHGQFFFLKSVLLIMICSYFQYLVLCLFCLLLQMTIN